MIAYIRGTIHAIREDHLIVDVHGLGYQVFCTSPTLAAAGVVGGEVELDIETQVRDDAITLFGFSDDLALAWFRRIQKIQGVGARLALAILSTLDADALQLAIQAQDKATITRAPGVGNKLAQRIITELRDFQATGATGAAMPAIPINKSGGDKQSDAVSALVNLGYSASDATQAVRQAGARKDAVDDVGWLVTAGLRALAT